MRSAGSHSGAYVRDLTKNRRLYARRARDRRILASNAKLFTTAALLDRFGTERGLTTRVRGRGELTDRGAWIGDLYLMGGGDPTLGTSSFARGYGSRASVGRLSRKLKRAGVERVRGRIVGDESRYDSLRGGPSSDYRTSIYVGPLSALSYNAGYASGGFQSDPPSYAASRLERSLESRGVEVTRPSRSGTTPPGTSVLAGVRSPSFASLVRHTNKSSDNFFAEMLTKELGTPGAGPGTTRRGARRTRRFARRLGASARIVDGSGLSRRNRARPREVVDLLAALTRRPQYPAVRASLPIAGRDGTLASRMEGEAAEGRCRAKTGTLSGVSTLSGYCKARGGAVLAFSFLMSGTDVYRARRLQDRMANALARYGG